MYGVKKIILKPALDINNNDQHINNYTIIVTKTDKKIIVDEENAKSIKEDRMLEISVKHCKINKNIDEIVKVAIMESVVIYVLVIIIYIQSWFQYYRSTFW